MEQSDVEPISRALWRVRLWVVASLVACAVLIALGPSGGGELPVPYTAAALALAVASIASHHLAARPRTPVRRHAALVSASFLFAAAIGVVGLVGAYASGDRQTGLLFAAGGAIFALRPTRRAVVRRRPQ